MISAQLTLCLEWITVHVRWFKIYSCKNYVFSPVLTTTQSTWFIPIAFIVALILCGLPAAHEILRARPVQQVVPETAATV